MYSLFLSAASKTVCAKLALLEPLFPSNFRRVNSKVNDAELTPVRKTIPPSRSRSLCVVTLVANAQSVLTGDSRALRTALPNATPRIPDLSAGKRSANERSLTP